MYCYMSTFCITTELQAKFLAEQKAKVKAIEKFDTAQHQCSMLELDIKNSHDEVKKLTKDLEIATNKVLYCI